MRLSSILNIHRAPKRLCEVVIGHPEVRVLPGFVLPGTGVLQIQTHSYVSAWSPPMYQGLTLNASSSETAFPSPQLGKDSCCRLLGHLIHPLRQTHHLIVITCFIMDLPCYPVSSWG